MLTFLLDVIVGYFIAKHVRNIGPIILASIGGGWLAQIIGTVLVRLFLGDDIPNVELFGGLFLGFIIHPIFIFVLAKWFIKQKSRKAK